MNNMVRKKTWKEFQDTHLLWWINRILHTFGWAIVMIMAEDGSITDAYPARVKFRGFKEKDEEEGFIGLSEYVANMADELLEEVKE